MSKPKDCPHCGETLHSVDVERTHTVTHETIEWDGDHYDLDPESVFSNNTTDSDTNYLCYYCGGPLTRAQILEEEPHEA
jgi:hypothetical protein